MPEREDQGRMYRCVVSNRALGDGRSIEATVVLDVDCEYFSKIYFWAGPGLKNCLE